MADLSSRYILQTLLGSGCSAGVFTAVDASRSERVAVKLTTRRPGMRWRSMLATYEREALLLRQCAHRNIVPCIDVLTSDRSCAIVLGLCPGGDCQQLVQRHGALAERAALHIAQQLCAALAFMHGRRVIHRDVKLDNVCVCNLGFTGLPHVQLCDFGHACHLDGACAGMTRCACEGVCVGSVDDGFRGTHGYAPRGRARHWLVDQRGRLVRGRRPVRSSRTSCCAGSPIAACMRRKCRRRRRARLRRCRP